MSKQHVLICNKCKGERFISCGIGTYLSMPPVNYTDYTCLNCSAAVRIVEAPNRVVVPTGQVQVGPDDMVVYR